MLPFYQKELCEATGRREALDKSRNTPRWQRYLGYPLVMLSLVILTTTSLICVILNVLQILAGVRSLPIYQVEHSSYMRFLEILLKVQELLREHSPKNGTRHHRDILRFCACVLNVFYFICSKLWILALRLSQL